MLLGLTGKAGVGKTTVANMLTTEHGFYDLAFADPLKAAAANIFGLELYHFYDEQLKEAHNDFWGMTPRKMLQVLGTDACRNVIDKDIWLKSLSFRFRAAQEMFSDIVITDVRFNNEAEMIRNMGGKIVHIVGNRKSNLSGESQAHKSEEGVFFAAQDFTLNNKGTIEELPGEVAFLLAMMGPSK